jgi:uncharacterized membrane protein YfcA
VTGLELILAGLLVGVLVGATGMGAGSLMAPVLISMFNVGAVAAVGTDLMYSAITKIVGGARHLTLRTVNVEIALWMAAGSVPSSVLGVVALNRLAASEGAAIQSDMKVVIGIALMLVAVTVAVRTFVTIRGMWDASKAPADADVGDMHRYMALLIGIVFGFIFGLTSVGAGAFFGMALVTIFPLSARRVVGTDLFHGALVTCAAATASYFLLPSMRFSSIAYLMVGSIPGILIGSQITVALPEKALRGSLASVLALSSLKMLGAF